MKTARDPRHRKRQEVVQQLFSHSFNNLASADTTTATILASLEQIDAKITEIAPDFPIDKINKIDLAILRLSVYELTIGNTEPPKVIIDEAIELAKEFGGESSPGFINGALGKLLRRKEDNETTGI
jgi:transcription antitermination factor NusB